MAPREPVMPVREITAILVSWNDAEEVLAAVRSLAEARCRMPPGGPRASLLVVDNGGGIPGHPRPPPPVPGAPNPLHPATPGLGAPPTHAARPAPRGAL